MLKRLEVKNFKSLVDFSIDFEPFTVLIGQNGSGKSTALQALDLLAAFSKGNVNDYLEQLGWNWSTELSSKGSTSLDLQFVLTFEVEGESFSWMVRFRHWTDGNLVVVQERVKSEVSKFSFEYLQGFELELWSADFNRIQLPPMNVESMSRSILTAFTIKDAPIEIKKIVNQLGGIFLLKIESAEELRKSRNLKSAPNIGRSGKLLPAYLHNLDTESRSRIDQQLSRFIQQIVKVKTHVESDLKVGLLFEEKFPDPHALEDNWDMRPNQMSDGTLLVLALLATILGATKGSVLLLDEIENGIDPNHVSILVQLLEEAVKTRGVQVILATHSPVILNYVEEEGVNYLSRTQGGNVVANPLFKRKELKKMLEYMNPGEVWLNLEEKDLTKGD